MLVKKSDLEKLSSKIIQYNNGSVKISEKCKYYIIKITKNLECSSNVPYYYRIEFTNLKVKRKFDDFLQERIIKSIMNNFRNTTVDIFKFCEFVVSSNNDYLMQKTIPKIFISRSSLKVENILIPKMRDLLDVYQYMSDNILNLIDNIKNRISNLMGNVKYKRDVKPYMVNFISNIILKYILNDSQPSDEKLLKYMVKNIKLEKIIKYILDKLYKHKKGGKESQYRFTKICRRIYSEIYKESPSVL